MSGVDTLNTIEQHITDCLDEVAEPILKDAGEELGYRISREFLLEGPWSPETGRWNLIHVQPGRVFLIAINVAWHLETAQPDHALELVRLIDETYRDDLELSALILHLPVVHENDPHSSTWRRLREELMQNGWEVATTDMNAVPQGCAPVLLELTDSLELLGNDEDPLQRQYAIGLQLDIPSALLDDCLRAVARGVTPNAALKSLHSNELLTRLW